jgi:hypothetical protein
LEVFSKKLEQSFQTKVLKSFLLETALHSKASLKSFIQKLPNPSPKKLPDYQLNIRKNLLSLRRFFSISMYFTGESLSLESCKKLLSSISPPFKLPSYTILSDNTTKLKRNSNIIFVEMNFFKRIAMRTMKLLMYFSSTPPKCVIALESTKKGKIKSERSFIFA